MAFVKMAPSVIAERHILQKSLFKGFNDIEDGHDELSL